MVSWTLPPIRARRLVKPMTTAERFEYLLPCGHKSTGLACFQCAVEEYLADQSAAEKLKPVIPMSVPNQLVIPVADPPHVQRFAAGSRRR